MEGFVYYYFLNHGFFLTALRNMVLRCQDGEITLFPAIPRQLEDHVEFSHLPVGGGLRVSGKLCGQQGEALFMRTDGCIVLKLEGRIRGYSISQSELAKRSGDTLRV